jgi:hypothetical protein
MAWMVAKARTPILETGNEGPAPNSEHRCAMERKAA